MEELVAVGKVHGTFGVKGNLKFELFLDLRLPEEIFLKRDDSLINLKIQTVDRKKGLIKFYGYDNLEKAKELKNSIIYIPKNYLPKLKEDEYFIFELIDSDVYVSNKKIGKIKQVDDRLTQVNLVINCEDGKDRYLPFINQFIEKFDRDEKKIYIKPPEGWFEL